MLIASLLSRLIAHPSATGAQSQFLQSGREVFDLISTYLMLAYCLMLMEVQNWVEGSTPELHTSCARTRPRPQVHKSKMK